MHKLVLVELISINLDPVWPTHKQYVDPISIMLLTSYLANFDCRLESRRSFKMALHKSSSHNLVMEPLNTSNSKKFLYNITIMYVAK